MLTRMGQWRLCYLRAELRWLLLVVMAFVHLDARGGATAIQDGPGTSNGLVAAYSFDDGSGEMLTDVSGNNNHGIISGAVWTTIGRFGTALFFNGISDWVTIDDAPSLDLTTGMTLEAWVYPIAPAPNWSTVLLKEQPAALVYALYAGSPANRPGVYYFTAFEQGVNGPTELPANTWSHLAATNDGMMLRLYVNGDEVASEEISGSLVYSDGVLRLGGNSVWGEFFYGQIDEVRIYNRALTGAEIQIDMNTPIGNVAPSPPLVSFSATPTVGSRPLTVAFSNTSVGYTTSWLWEFGDGTTSTEQHPMHTYTAAETYTVRLTVANEIGSDSQTQADLITVAPPPPVASFTGSVQTGLAPLTVAFSDTSTGDITSWLWEFGDGTVSSDQHPVHTYTRAGTYSVRLTVLGDGGIGKTTLVWDDRNNPLDEVGGYRLYYGLARGVYSSSVDMGRQKTYTLTELRVGQTYYLAVTAYDVNGRRESAFSQEASATITVPSDKVTQTIYVVATPPQVMLEAGEVVVDHRWRAVSFEVPFVDPVVVATGLSHNDTTPAVVRIRHVTPTGFEICVQEWDYLDGPHRLETVGYIVLERGHHTLPDGTQIEAGRFKTDRTVGKDLVGFQQAFGQVPVVLTAVTSVHEAAAVVGRVGQVGPEGFRYRLQEQGLNAPAHVLETVAYIAWEPGAGVVDGVRFAVQRTEEAVQHGWYPLVYATAFGAPPVLVAGLQTLHEKTSATVRWKRKDGQGVWVRVVEERSQGNGPAHSPEVVGYMVFSMDADGDGILSRDEVVLYGTSPSMGDTDGDGISDGDERVLWGANWAHDYDGDGLINLLDPDADGDSYADGLELYYGSDPGDPASIPLLTDLLIVGEVVVDHRWRAVSFEVPFVDPVVVATGLSHNDTTPAVVRIRHVTPTGFEICVQEWDYLDGPHRLETVGYIVLERGHHTLPDGTQIEAGRFKTDRTVGKDLVGFQQAFGQVPVVLTAVTSVHEAAAVVGRVGQVGPEGFRYRLQEQGLNAPAHVLETVAYIAWEPGAGVVDGVRFAVQRTEEAVQHGWYPLVYATAFGAPPVLVAGLQTLHEKTSATVRWKRKDGQGVWVRVVEERSQGNGPAHSPEVVGYIAIAR